MSLHYLLLKSLISYESRIDAKVRLLSTPNLATKVSTRAVIHGFNAFLHTSYMHSPALGRVLDCRHICSGAVLSGIKETLTFSMPMAWEPWPGKSKATGPSGAFEAAAGIGEAGMAGGAAVGFAAASAALSWRRFSFFAFRSLISCARLTSSA